MKTNKKGITTEREHGWIIVRHGWDGEMIPIVFDDPHNLDFPIWGDFSDEAILQQRQIFEIYTDKDFAEKMRTALEKKDKFEIFEVKEIIRNWRIF